jgi:signal peptidase I
MVSVSDLGSNRNKIILGTSEYLPTFCSIDCMSNKQHQSKSTSAPKVDNPYIETLKTLGLSAVFAFGLRAAVVQAFYIPSESMLPTLQINDKLMVDKISYRFSNPVRGDIVVFNPTAQLEKELDADGKPRHRDSFVKRVIGIPGDRVEVKSGKVYINGAAIDEKYLNEAPNYNWSSTELTPDGVIPKGQYLVLGDNRNNSYDSHYWGFVPKDKIVGKAVVRYWPIDRLGGINP